MAITKKRDVPMVDIAGHDDGGYILLEKPISAGENGLWQYDEQFEKTGLIYFTCPYCANIQSIYKGQISRRKSSTAAIAEDDRIYQSIWCAQRGDDCGRHLWIHFEGLKL